MRPSVTRLIVCVWGACSYRRPWTGRTPEASRADQESQIKACSSGRAGYPIGSSDTIEYGAQSLILADVFFDPGNESRSVAFEELLNAGTKLMNEIHARIIANVRTKVAKRVRN